MHPTVDAVTKRIIERSRATRQDYLDRMGELKAQSPQRSTLSCGNLAHGFAACNQSDKDTLKFMNKANVAIVSAYNDMLSAHQPYQDFPDVIRKAANGMGSVAQFAGGTPAMCDGVTQGQPGMELSLFSRDTIAMSTSVALSHNMFDATMLLGICDKIVPGLLIGSLSFGYLPTILVPAGPMPSGLPNKEKQRIRQLYAEGKIGKDELLEAESQSYHSPGTCTFYGTANSNQLLVEVMGLHLPGSAFVNPGTPLREALTREATEQVIRLSKPHGGTLGLGDMVDEKSIVNALVALLVTGGSTNHTIHWIAIARAAGIIVDWNDYSELSSAVPSMTRIYPNGQEDVNAFHEAGGTPFLIRELLSAGLLHNDVETVVGHGLEQYARMPELENDKLVWKPAPEKSAKPDVLSTAAEPFAPDGGLRVLDGNLGRGVIKVSAVAEEHRVVKAPAVVFNDQNELKAAFDAGDLNRDCVVVVRFQGPKANGMPELHKLTPYLGVLQDRGYKVALVTDGRMSGASGKVPAAIHVYPEAANGGELCRVRNGDVINLDAVAGTLEIEVSAEEFASREAEKADLSSYHHGLGRELFGWMRKAASNPEEGASFFWNHDA
ncbi:MULTISPECIES: phosphogluconate dehydratase [Marinobacter]|jgi:phosphogluconate dehydratase|uniref:Phosphogluconate dehydratase n=1 Tax=Marinobacter salarius TaxID=1420917 RepID=A0ABY1FK29_9GAMM|nr:MULTISPECIES: phosphogluconate dehydratase [Marinobacter]KXJ45298.1 MAG: phosphogluconate dehydratase [Marinobacter sp. Hex_13]MBJ7277254.1 phosphogluconate dehydratase [Marinobacter salarius]MBJ7300749.1 phosphogluconate dehydratase [Marinobacter salarius]MBS8230795.1 phosphogluconate dehydratase [Marinobacter salarius]MCC4282578.1 phosphogluconate dehydratase [Marinobacter salarius]|tara:strand:- start:1628 stop:3448 length:1821 start_codon:yes stop_codon:yes gene_type:complete